MSIRDTHGAFGVHIVAEGEGLDFRCDGRCDRHGRLRLWHVRCKVRHHYEADIGRHRALGRNRARCFRVSEYAKSKRLSGVGVRRAGSAGRHFFPLSGR